MKVLIHLELTDEQRALFSNSLCKKGMASRKEVRAFVHEAVQRLLKTQEINNESPDSESARETENAPTHQPKPEGYQNVRSFVPSRGDEEYLYRPKDSELAAACTAVLDGLKYIEKHAWNALEENRQ